MSRARLYWLLASLPLLAGCASEAMSVEPPEFCRKDSDCAPDQVCWEEGCGNALDFMVRVVPSGTELVPQDFHWESVTPRLDLPLTPPGRLAGALRRATASGAVDYTGGMFTVRARGYPPGLPALPFDRSFTVTVASGAQFNLPLPAGSWDISATPLDLDLPPAFAQRLLTRGQQVDPGLTLAAAEDLVVVEGSVVRTAALPWPGGGAPLFRVQVLDDADSTPLSQARSFLGSERFRLIARKVDRPMRLSVTTDGSTVAAPSKDFLSDTAGRFSDVLELGDYGEPVEAAGAVVDAQGQAIAGAEVRFEATVRGGGKFTTSVQTDLAGQFRTQLLPSVPEGQGEAPTSYRIQVVPPANSPFASVADIAAIPRATTLRTITCPPKVVVSGSVFASTTGGRLARVVVHYEGNPAAAIPGSSRGDVQTDAEGRFTLRVEPGSYRLVVKPGLNYAGLPWTSRLVDAFDAETLDIAVGQARVVSGSVTTLGPGGIPLPVPNAIVSVYRTPAGPSKFAPPLLYEAITDGWGDYKVLVPRSAEDSAP